MDKKAQITVFIIIGVLMLIIFFGALYLSDSVTEEKFTEEGEPIIDEVPQEFVPIQTFTENCLQDVGKRGLVILGQQGGYIYPELLGEFSISEPTNSEGINLDSAKVPYWHYNMDPNEAERVRVGNHKPNLYNIGEGGSMSVEAQLERYVEEELTGCLNGYKAFEEQAFKVEQGEVEMKVKVIEGGINFLLDMSLNVKRGAAEEEMDRFFVKIPLNLKHYYEIAELIQEAEYNYSFLENQALDLIQIFSALEADKLPPMSETTFDLTPTVYWTVPDVKAKLKNMLISYVPMLRFLGSENFYTYDYPVTDLSDLYQKAYDNTVLPLYGADDLEISFDYFGWPFYYDTNSNGDIIEPSSVIVNKWFFIFGTQSYNTVYDLSYPVLVTLRDSRAFDGEGYVFMFGLEANIRNNEAIEKTEEIFNPPLSLSKSMVCDKDKRGTEVLKTKVVDSSEWGEALEDVRIGFDVQGQDNCFMGLSDSEGELESDYPAVIGGTVSFIKEGYLTSFYPIDTYQYVEEPGIIGYAAGPYYDSERVVELHKYRDVKVRIRKVNLDKCITSSGIRRCPGLGPFSGGKVVYTDKPELVGGTHEWVASGKSDLRDSEQAILTLDRIGDLSERVFNPEFSTVVGVSGKEEYELRLVPGRYKLSGQVILNEQVVIPKEKRCKKALGGLVKKCFDLDESLYDEYFAGQLSWEEEEDYWDLTPEMLYGAEEIIFYIPVQNIKNVPAEEHIRIIEDIKLVGEMKEISKKIKSSLRPEVR